jgi:ketosteroid isomerase-like protein
MTPNADLIRAFYAAFARRDHATMAGCYGPGATFTDPAFGGLTSQRIGAMWRMLCERARDLHIEVSGIQADADRGAAHWEARYTFSGTGRPVHNRIDASFQFRDGLIHRHVDRFDLYAWSRQAFGLRGLLLGWSPPMQGTVRRRAAEGLDAFMRKNGLSSDAS